MVTMGLQAIKTKVCSKCGVRKPVEKFGSRADSRDGFKPHCRKCHNAQERVRLRDPGSWRKHREQVKRWEEKNPGRMNSYGEAHRQRRREYLDAWKVKRGCGICGKREGRLHLYHPEFGAFTNAAIRWEFAWVRQELRRCSLVCVSCDRKRMAEEDEVYGTRVREMVYARGSVPAHCPACGLIFDSPDDCHCALCHAHFTSERAFDTHYRQAHR